MKTNSLHILRTAAFAAVLPLIPLVASASDISSSGGDEAQKIMNIAGSLEVQSAGRMPGNYVEIGAWRETVSSHLGRPSLALADGTWLYYEFSVDDSAAKGVLVVRFNKGSVSELKLVSQDVANSICAASTPSEVHTTIALGGAR
jgi:hypothetical protein